jgi:hypothetical protein
VLGLVTNTGVSEAATVVVTVLVTVVIAGVERWLAAGAGSPVAPLPLVVVVAADATAGAASASSVSRAERTTSRTILREPVGWGRNTVGEASPGLPGTCAARVYALKLHSFCPTKDRGVAATIEIAWATTFGNPAPSTRETSTT